MYWKRLENKIQTPKKEEKDEEGQKVRDMMNNQLITLL